MRFREKMLPEEWYPGEKALVYELIRKEKQISWKDEGVAPVVIVPHGPWKDAGSLSFRGVRSLQKDRDVILVVGGNLASQDPVLHWCADAVRTPLGDLKIDSALEKALERRLSWQNEVYPDTSIEILLPFLKFLFPETPVFPLRLPPSKEVVEQVFRALQEVKQRSGMKIGLVASSNLAFLKNSSPRGASGNWLRREKDGPVVKILLERDYPALMGSSVSREYSGSGALGLALLWAREENCSGGKVGGYGQAPSPDKADPGLQGYGAFYYPCSST